jgi:hypothetical protein
MNSRIKNGFQEINNFISENKDARLALFRHRLSVSEIKKLTSDDKNSIFLMQMLTRLQVIRDNKPYCDILKCDDIYDLL